MVLIKVRTPLENLGLPFRFAHFCELRIIPRSVPFAGSISNCNFTGNQAHSGWGGAIYGVNADYPLVVKNSTFYSNRAYSSYTNRGMYVYVYLFDNLRAILTHTVVDFSLLYTFHDGSSWWGSHGVAAFQFAAPILQILR